MLLQQKRVTERSQQVSVSQEIGSAGWNLPAGQIPKYLRRKMKLSANALQHKQFRISIEGLTGQQRAQILIAKPKWDREVREAAGVGGPGKDSGSACVLCRGATPFRIQTKEATGAPAGACGARQTPDRVRMVASSDQIAVTVDQRHTHVDRAGILPQNVPPAFGIQQFLGKWHGSHIPDDYLPPLAAREAVPRLTPTRVGARLSTLE